MKTYENIEEKNDVCYIDGKKVRLIAKRKGSWYYQYIAWYGDKLVNIRDARLAKSSAYRGKIVYEFWSHSAKRYFRSNSRDFFGDGKKHPLIIIDQAGYDKYIALSVAEEL